MHKYHYHIEGPKEVKEIFDNFKLNDTNKISASKKFPVVNEGEFYNYIYYYGICDVSDKYCTDEKKENRTFYILNVTENKIKYLLSSASSNIEKTEEIVFNKNDFEQIFKENFKLRSAECQEFICGWFLYADKNLSYKLKIRRNITDVLLKNLKDEIFDVIKEINLINVSISPTNLNLNNVNNLFTKCK